MIVISIDAGLAVRGHDVIESRSEVDVNRTTDSETALEIRGSLTYAEI